MPLLGRLWHNLQFRVNFLFATALIFSLVAVVTVFLLFGRDMLIERDRKLVEQTGALVVAELEAQVVHAETLVQAIASSAAAAPLSPEQMNQQLYQQLADSHSPNFIAGGGIWPEPGRLIPGVERASLFWGRDAEGQLQFFNDYNQPDEPAYFRTEWYAPVRYLNAHHCYWSRAYADPYTLMPMVTCSAPVRRNGQFWGVATVDVKLSGMTAFLGERLAGIGGYGVLLDRNEGLLALPQMSEGRISSIALTDQAGSDYRQIWLDGDFKPLQQMMQQRLKIISDKPRQRLQSKLLAQSDDIDPSEALKIADYLITHVGVNHPESLPAQTLMLMGDPLYSERAQVSLISLTHVDWLLALVVPDRIAVANADRLAFQGMAALVGAVMLGLLLVGYQVQNSLVVPLKLMINRLRVSGAEPVRLDESAGFELGQLAQAYNQQQQALQASQAVINESRLCLQSMMDTATDGIVTLDPSGCILEINPSAAQLLGDGAERLRGTDFRQLFSQRAQTPVVEGLEQIINAQQLRISQLEAELRGVAIPLYIELSMSGWQAAGRSHITVFMRDITERKTAEQRVHYMATRDSLTGLYNRYQLAERLATGLKVAQRHHQKLAVLFIDLDHFKDVNDRLGHQAGDQLLMGVAERLLLSRRAEDSVARLGGDEFAVVLQDIQQTADASAAAEQIVQALLQPFWLEGEACYVGASVGITLYPDNASSADELLKQADSAMYLAKEEGRNTWRFYAPEQHQKQQQRRHMLAELSEAISRQQLVLYYQPMVQAVAADPRCAPVAFEALLRWQHPEFGTVSPMVLVPLAEEAGLMADIGHWVVEEACAQLARWQKEGLGLCQLSVNVSAQQLQQGNFETGLARLLGNYQLSAEQIRLEITESLLISDDCAAQLHRLDELGATLAIDDFGTGYSSLSYLQRFPVSVIKLDRSFVDEMDNSASSQTICQAVISLAHSLGMEVVAEGVETAVQQKMLQQMGCDQLQGNLFTRPLPAGQAIEWLKVYRCSVVNASQALGWDS